MSYQLLEISGSFLHFGSDARTSLTSCARGDTICLRTLQVDNIFAFIRQVAVLFRHNNIFEFIRQVAPVPTCWLFKTSETS